MSTKIYHLVFVVIFFCTFYTYKLSANIQLIGIHENDIKNDNSKGNDSLLLSKDLVYYVLILTITLWVDVE